VTLKLQTRQVSKTGGKKITSFPSSLWRNRRYKWPNSGWVTVMGQNLINSRTVWSQTWLLLPAFPSKSVHFTGEIYVHVNMSMNFVNERWHTLHITNVCRCICSIITLGEQKHTQNEKLLGPILNTFLCTLHNLNNSPVLHTGFPCVHSQSYKTSESYNIKLSKCKHSIFLRYNNEWGGSVNCHRSIHSR